MKIRLLALAGLAISFALPGFAQQTTTPDPQITQKIRAISKAYAAREQEPWVPGNIAALPQLQYPHEFDKYISDTTEKLKRRLTETLRGIRYQVISVVSFGIFKEEIFRSLHAS